MSKLFQPWRRPQLGAALFGAALLCLTPLPAFGQQPALWTLEESIRRAREIAPELRGAQAAVTARQGALHQAGAWLNSACTWPTTFSVSGSGANRPGSFPIWSVCVWT